MASPSEPTGHNQQGGESPTVLQVHGLCTVFDTEDGPARVVDGVDLAVHAGQTLALVGESGSGKSVTSLSVMRLVPSPPGRIAAGSILFRAEDGVVEDLASLPESRMRRVRGARIGMVFQEPMTSLNPLLTVGEQIAESIRFHDGASRREARARALAMLERVRLPDPGRRLAAYPHELSGGMRQRVMIAIALACRPRLLIADEPTTALDVTIQAQILDLLEALQDELGMAVLFVTHNLGVVAEIADRVAVMYAGRIVEEGPVRAVLARPAHPYTRALMASVPTLSAQGRDRSRRLAAIPGRVPSPTRLPAGCSFAPRCGFATTACTAAEPPLEAAAPGHLVRCIRRSML